MGTSPRGEMLPGTQVGLLRKTCSGSSMSGLGGSEPPGPCHLAPPCDGQGFGRGMKGSQGLGLCVQLAALLYVSAVSVKSAVGENRLTHAFPSPCSH